MRLFLFDLETTGLDKNKDRVIEHGYILWDTRFKKPLGESSSFWFDESYPESWPLAEKVNGITREHIKTTGFAPASILKWLDDFIAKHKVDYLVAHNGKSFDKPFLLAEADRANLECATIRKTPLIDTRTDLPFDPAPKSRHLGHLAYDYRVFHDPDDKHSALFDCKLMLGILQKFDLEAVIAMASSPDIVLKAHVTRDNKDLAKFNGYRWDADKLIWHRTLKQSEIEIERKRCKDLGFEITEIA